ncbi:MAG: hypothetical protein FD155_3225 [Bacteroidetes bacterium]|nr:MAG: hypothetical protein FD155_3225 [Bacteroidota bacterium]
MVTAKTTKSELVQVFKHLRVSAKGTKPQRMKIQCEVTVYDGKLNFVVPGISYDLKCETTGVGRFSTIFLYLDNIVHSKKNEDVMISFKDQYVTFGSVTFSTNTTFFRNDRILRNIQLPINFIEADIIRLLNEGYTEDEIRFNRLDKPLAAIKQKMDKNILAAFNLLKPFGIYHHEIKDLVYIKLGFDSHD